MRLSEADLERLNAYHDGELDAAEAEAMAARLNAEPELRAALEGLREVSAALGALKPRRPAAAGDPAARPAAVRPLRWGRVAAGIAGIAVLASALLWGALPREPHSPAAWHERFLARAYPQDSGTVATPVAKWISAEPDLSAANLRLVDVAGDHGSDVYLHYAGMNGCRLTFGAHRAAPTLPAARGALLVHGWDAGDMHYSLIADGMDRGKFAAIIALLEQRTHEHDPGTGAVMALREATDSALPCA